MADKTLGACTAPGRARVDEPAAGTLPDDFETALSQLEALVEQMEDGQLPLEESLAAYQKGVQLARVCQQRLDAAEQQVKVLQRNLLVPLGGDPDAGADEG
jgi:exodeoxyribonuclease VII small subunit